MHPTAKFADLNLRLFKVWLIDKSNLVIFLKEWDSNNIPGWIVQVHLSR